MVTSTTPRRRLKFKYLTLVALVPALILMFIVTQYASSVDPLLRVLNLMGTFIHEGGHTVATLLTGGQIFELVVKPDGSGYAMLAGGNAFWVLPAGYMTVTLLTALMFLVNNKTRWGEVIPLILGVMFLYLTFTYGAKLEGGITTSIVGYICGLFLLYIGIHPVVKIPFTTKKIGVPDWLWMTIVNWIALYYGLGGILSLEFLTRFADHGNSDDISRFTDTYFPSMHPTSVAWILMAISILVWIGVLLVYLLGFFRKEKPKVEL